MRLDRARWLALVFATFATAARADVSATLSGTPARAPDPIDGANPMIAPVTSSIVNAAVSGKQTGTVFRATFMPGLLADRRYIDFVSEAKFVLSTDTSTSLTRVAFGMGYNPFALFGARQQEIINQSDTKFDCGGKLVPPNDAVDAAKNAVDAQKKVVEQSRQALQAAQQAAAQAADAVQRKRGEIDQLTDAAMKAGLLEHDKRVALDSALVARKEVPQARDDWQRAWRAAYDQTNALANAQREVRSLERALEVAQTNMELARNEQQKEQDALTKAQSKLDGAKKVRDDGKPDREENFAKCNAQAKAYQWQHLNRGFVPQVGFVFSTDLYPYGQAPSATDPTMQASLNAFGGVSIELDVSFHFLEVLGLDLWGSYRYARASGAPGIPLANYYGSGATASWLFYSFLNRDDPRGTPDYIQQGFLPGLVIGFSFQQLHCDGRQNCATAKPMAPATIDSYSLTPFVDVRIKQALQLRFSLPVTLLNQVDTKQGTAVAPTLTLAGSFSQL